MLRGQSLIGVRERECTSNILVWFRWIHHCVTLGNIIFREEQNSYIMFDHEIEQISVHPCWEQLEKNHSGPLTFQSIYICKQSDSFIRTFPILQQGDTEHTLAVYGPISRINPFGMPQNRLELLRLVSDVLDSKSDSPITVVSRYLCLFLFFNAVSYQHYLSTYYRSFL